MTEDLAWYSHLSWADFWVIGAPAWITCLVMIILLTRVQALPKLQCDMASELRAMGERLTDWVAVMHSIRGISQEAKGAAEETQSLQLAAKELSDQHFDSLRQEISMLNATVKELLVAVNRQ